MQWHTTTARRVLILTSFLLLAGLIQGCSSKKRPPPPPPAATPAPPPAPAPVTTTSVTVTAVTADFVTADSAAAGVKLRFAATATRSNNTTADVTSSSTWASSNPEILAFETAGYPYVATAKKPGGPVTVTATSSGVPGTLSYSVTAAAAESLTISPARIPDVPVGQEGNFTATAILTDKSTVDVTNDVDWTSSAGSVVVIGNDTGNKGRAVALAVGQSSIKASTGALDSQSVAVKVFQPVAAPEFVIEPAAPQALPLGRVQQFRALLKYPSGDITDVTDRVTWQSGAASIARFPAPTDNDFKPGQLLANPTTTGTSQITALDPKSGETSSAVTATVTNPTIQSIELTPAGTATSPLLVGANRQLGVVATFSDSIPRDITQTVTWAAGGRGYLDVTNTFGSRGLVKALEETPAGGPNDTIVITDPVSTESLSVEIVTAGRILESLQITPAKSQDVPLGKSQQFEATAVFTDSTKDPVTNVVTWESSGPDKVTISNNADDKGKATAVAPGSSTVTASYRLDEQSVVRSNSVLVTATSATLETIMIEPAGDVSLALGRTQRLTAKGNFSDGSSRDISDVVNWRSGDTAIVTVGNSGTSRGVVTGVAEGGPVSITAREPDSGTFASKPVSVSGKAFEGIAIFPDSTVTRPVGVPYTEYVASAAFSDGSGIPITEEVQWVSSDPLIASVSNEEGKRGHVFPKAEGSVQITAKSDDITSPPVTFTVSAAVLQSIALSPSDPQALEIDGTVKYTATGTFSDGSERDVSAAAVFRSDEERVAVASNAAPNIGTVTGVGPGLANITASKDDVTSSVAEVVVTQPAPDLKTVAEVLGGCCEGETVLLEGTIGSYNGIKSYDLNDSTGSIAIEWEGQPIPEQANVRVTGVAQGSVVIVSNWTQL